MYGDWILRYPGTEYRFGPPQHDVELRTWAFAANSYRVDDTPLPRTDGIAFGRDFIEAGEIRIELKIDLTGLPLPAEERARRAWAIRMELDRVWRADTVRDTPRAFAELVMGGEQMIEGRPRRVSFDDKHQGRGLIFASASFVPVSTATYPVDADGNTPWIEQSIGLVPASIGGIVAPLVAPISTARSSSRARPFTVGGNNDVWPILTVQGPLQSGGQIELVNRWVLKLSRALNYDDVIVIDTRPGRRVMTLNDRPMNVLSPSGARISQAFIQPGLQEIALRGTSVEGTARLTARWQEQKIGD